MNDGIARIQNQFKKGKVNIGFLAAGDGGIERTLVAAKALIAGGVNLLEIGLPFSDPIADGAVIQAAYVRACQSKINLTDVLQLIVAIKQHSNIPIVLFSYLNPILSAYRKHGSLFAKQLNDAGVDGLLIVDSPFEENEKLFADCFLARIAPIFVIAESTAKERMQVIDKHSHGFIYYACQKGTTGMRDKLPETFPQQITTIKSTMHLPVVVGFGISKNAEVREVLQYADGVVVGSLFVKAVADGMDEADLTSLACDVFRP